MSFILTSGPRVLFFTNRKTFYGLSQCMCPQYYFGETNKAPMLAKTI